VQGQSLLLACWQTAAYPAPSGETFAPFPGSWGFVRSLRGLVMRVRRLLLLVLLGAGPVRAHSVSNEVALGLSEDTPASPHGPHVADQLTFRFDLSDDWSMKLGGTYTYDTETPPPEGAAFATSSAQVLTVVGGLEWDVSPRVTVYMDVSGSPRASQSFDGVVTFEGPGGIKVPFDVLLYNATSSVGVLGGVTWQLGGTEFLGTVFGGTVIDLSVGWTQLTTQQRVDGIVVDGTQSNRGELLVYCARFPRRCAVLRPFLKGGEDTLNQLSISLALLQPVGSSTDLGLAGSYYGYDQDPAVAVFFTARANVAAGDSLGGGFPLAPVRWSISPNLTQRFGAWSLAPWYQYLSYASSIGQAHVAGLRLSWRIDPSWTVWVTGSAQWDLLADPTSPTPDTARSSLVVSGRVALGFRARF
jgi:hypothetical protein